MLERFNKDLTIAIYVEIAGLCAYTKNNLKKVLKNPCISSFYMVKLKVKHVLHVYNTCLTHVSTSYYK